MAKQIESALVRCMDYRLTSRVNTWMEEQGIMDMCDIIALAGASQAVVVDVDSPDARCLLRQIRLAKELHGIQTLYLMHHTDCGAYGGHGTFENETQEQEKHIADMHKAKKLIEEQFDTLSVVCVLAVMTSDTDISMVTV